jgi:hypothetical protein
MSTIDTFPHAWNARILSKPPMIAPARQFVYPLYVPGEEDAMGRGALLLDVKPAQAPNFLATCALGFRDPSLPTGIFSCPRPQDILAVAGGYAYLIDTAAPERCLHLPVRPTTQILATPEAGVILLAAFHNVIAIDANGLRWESARVSWEGVTLTEVRDKNLHGKGWNLHTDREVAFLMDLATGHHTGGGFEAVQPPGDGTLTTNNR